MTPADILRRLLALAPHLHPSVSHRAQWEALLRDVRATMMDPTTEAMTATIRALLAQLEGQPVKHPQQAAERELARWLVTPATMDSEDRKEATRTFALAEVQAQP